MKNAIKNFSERISNGTLTKNDYLVLAGGVTGLLLIVILLLTYKLWLPPVLLIGVIGYYIYDANKPVKAQPYPPGYVVYVIYQCIFTVVSELTRHGHSLTMINPPIDMDDMLVTPEIVNKGNLPFIKLRLLKKENFNEESDSKEVLKKILQSRINSRLRSGKVEGVPYASIDGNIPIIYIDDVRSEGLYFVVDVAFVDNINMARYILQKSRISNPPPSSTSHFDKDF